MGSEGLSFDKGALCEAGGLELNKKALCETPNDGPSIGLILTNKQKEMRRKYKWQIIIQSQ